MVYPISLDFGEYEKWVSAIGILRTRSSNELGRSQLEKRSLRTVEVDAATGASRVW